MSRLTDYAVALLAQFAVRPGQHSAKELAETLHLPGPAVSKVLKLLARQGLLVTHRGVKGGFTLARAPEAISVAEVLQVFEGPMALTECSTAPHGGCELESCCSVSQSWRTINRAVADALDEVSLTEMVSGSGAGFSNIKESVRSRLSPRTLRV